MFFSTQNQVGTSRALGVHLPSIPYPTVRFPHTVEYMYLATIGMMLGAPLSVAAFLWKCMLPITLGNAIRGAVFVGVYNWWVYLRWEDGENDRKGGLSLDGQLGENGSWDLPSSANEYDNETMGIEQTFDEWNII